MILSDTDIRKALQDGRLIIDPLPSEEDIESTAVDLRFGDSLWVWNPEITKAKGEDLAIDLEKFDFKEFSELNLVKVEKEFSGKFRIKPGTVYLGETHEKLDLPAGSKLAARVEGKSQLGRLGLVVHMTAPMIHAGSGLGIITLELYNYGSFTLEITPKATRICQLIIEEVSSEPGARTGRMFLDQKSAKG